MIELFKQIKWQFLIFQRNNLITMIVVITAFYVLIIYFLKDFSGVEKFITLLIYNDPAIVGFIFIGISIILEKDQEVLPALFVTPLNQHIYLISRIITLSAIGFFGALAMTWQKLFNMPLFLPILAFFLPPSFSLVFVIFPTFWAYQGFNSLIKGGNFGVYMLIGFAHSILLLMLMIKRFIRSHFK